MSENKYELAKSNLLHGLRKMIAQSERLADDLAWWNENRTDSAPFDFGGDLAIASLARKVLRLVETDQRIPDELWVRLTEQCEANAAE